MMGQCDHCGRLVDVDGYDPGAHGPFVLCDVNRCPHDSKATDLVGVVWRPACSAKGEPVVYPEHPLDTVTITASCGLAVEPVVEAVFEEPLTGVAAQRAAGLRNRGRGRSRNKRVTTVYLWNEQHDELSELADERGTSFAALVRLAVAEYLTRERSNHG